MERRERELIMREGGVGATSPIEHAGERRLADDLVGSPLRGKPLRRRLRNFRPDLANYWTQLARGWRFDEVNDLIDRHNRFFPAEALLPMDPRTGDFVLVGGERYERRALDADWILERFPPVLERAA